jgi:hypothetical protein
LIDSMITGDPSYSTIDPFFISFACMLFKPELANS